MSRIQEKLNRVLADPRAQELRDKAIRSEAVARGEGADESKIYHGYYVDESDSSVFVSRDEVDEYRKLGLSLS